MKQLVALLILALAIPASVSALEAPAEPTCRDKVVSFFTESVPTFFTESVPAGASAAWRETKFHATVAGVAVAVFAKSAAVGTKNVTVDTAVAIRDTTVKVTKPLFW